MGKKQSRDVSAEEANEPSVVDEANSIRESSDEGPPVTLEVSSDAVKAALAQVLEAQPQPDPLMQEVRAFLDQRSILARKLADEIAATEKKLAELKRTAAQLFPEHQGESSAKDRKAKKPKPKQVAKTEAATQADG